MSSGRIAEAFFNDGYDGSMRRDILVIVDDIPTQRTIQGMMAAGNKEIKEDARKLRDMLRADPQGVEIWIGDWNDHGGPEPEDD